MLTYPTINLDANPAIRALTLIEREQVPFATALAINRVAASGQLAARNTISSVLTVTPRALPFMERLVYIGRADRPTKENPRTVIQIGNPHKSIKSPLRGDILARHVIGGPRRAASAARPFYIPTDEIRGGEYDVAPHRLYPVNIGLAPHRYAIPDRVSSVKGSKRRGTRRSYFVIDARATSNPKAWGIFERTAAGIRMIWAFRTVIELGAPRYPFYEVTTRTIENDWPREATYALLQAVRTAR